MLSIETCYKNHFLKLKGHIEELCGQFASKGFVFGAGKPVPYFQDDQMTPFRSAPYFRYICPALGAYHVVVWGAGQKPILLYFKPEDFWEDHTPFQKSYWSEHFIVEQYAEFAKLNERLTGFQGYHYLGPDEKEFEERGFLSCEEKMMSWWAWFRSFKSEYEALCVKKATEIAARGHRAAYDVFRSGGSELDIHLAYLEAARVVESELPYRSIIGLGEKASVLHYGEKRDHVQNERVLLIDCGASYQGYASDITRTYASRMAPSVFDSMISALNKEQLELIESTKVGMTFGDLTYESHLGVARVLINHGLLKGIDPDVAVSEGYTAKFYPHGVGHMLGLLVHDVGGMQKDRDGTPCDKDPRFPKMRTLRTIEKGQLFTVEPGIYFIPMLLEPLRGKKEFQAIHWPLLDSLWPCGGIRIEDNIYMSGEKAENLTRPCLP